MVGTTRLEVAADHPAQTLTFKVYGQIDSSRLTDLIIAAYEAHRAHWTYRRLFDYRRASGLYAFDQVERLLAWWHHESRDVPICHHVAVISGDVLFDFRARVFDNRYENGQICSFKTRQDALSWLDRVAPVRS
jgi:hypothetical protein